MRPSPSKRALFATSLVVGCLLGVFTPSHAGSGSPPQSCSQCLEERSNLEAVKSAFVRWGAGGNVFEGLLAEDVVWTIHGSGSAAVT